MKRFKKTGMTSQDTLATAVANCSMTGSESSVGRFGWQRSEQNRHKHNKLEHPLDTLPICPSQNVPP